MKKFKTFTFITLGIFLFFHISVPLNAQDDVGSFEFDGYDRRYQVYLPQNFQSNMPLVVSIHGYNEDIYFHKTYTEMHEVADTMGFVIVYPQGLNRDWNAGIIDPWRDFPDADDIGFICTLIDTMKKNFDIDLARVYCCGFSMGGRMSFRMAGECGQRLAAIAAVSGTMHGLANTWQPVQAMPIVQMHGTHDSYLPYAGSGDRWSVQKTLAYWLERNACAAQPDTFLFPDLVPGDNCTMQKISYTNCSNQTQVIHYKGITMGHSWPGSVTTYNLEGNKNLDINANVEILNFFKNHVNPLFNMAYAETPEVFPHYIPPQGDSLQIHARLVNPENHPATVSAVIEGINSAFRDSLPLFDDGLHGDDAAGDNLWGNKKWLSGLVENHYTIRIPSYDMTEDIYYFHRPLIRFTTSGPVVLDSFYISSSDTIAIAGDRISYTFVLRNTGETGTIKNLKTEIVALDTFAEPSKSRLSYDDLSVGEIVETNGRHSITFLEGDVTAKFELKIYSDGHHFWSDTFSVDVRVNAIEDWSRPAPKEFGLYQNYPNPFNPVTVIRYQLPKPCNTELSIYNLLGQKLTTLVSQNQLAGQHQVEWNATAFPSGIYYYMIKASKFKQVKKMVLIK